MHYKTNDDMLICELSYEGLPVELIAEKMEATLAQVMTTLHEYAVEFTHEMKETALIGELLKAGMTNKQVIKLTGFTSSNVSYMKKKLGLAKKAPRSKKTLQERYNEALEMIKSGKTVTDACRLVRLSPRDYNKIRKALA
jgi:hypothetical protein